MLADANFPAASVCSSGPEMVRADGEGCADVGHISGT